MAGIQWGNPKIAVEKIPDPNIVDSTNRHMQKNESVVLEVKDVFIITGRGIVVTGIVENRVKLCEQVRIINPDNTIVYSEVKGIELDWKLFDEARRGDNVGLLLVGVRKSDVQRGAIIEKIIYMENNPLFQVYLSDLLRTIIQNGGMSESKIWDFIYDHDGYKIGITYGDVERDIEIARAHQEKGDFSITRKKFDIFQKSIPAQSINENIIENPTNNNVFVIEKKVPLKQDIFAIIGRIEGNLTIRPNTKMQINTFLGEKLNVNILGIKWDGRMRQEIGGGSDIMLSVSGISIDSVDIGDELTL